MKVTYVIDDRSDEENDEDDMLGMDYKNIKELINDSIIDFDNHIGSEGSYGDDQEDAGVEEF